MCDYEVTVNHKLIENMLELKTKNVAGPLKLVRISKDQWV